MSDHVTDSCPASRDIKASCFCTAYGCDFCRKVIQKGESVFVYDTVTIEADLLDGTRRKRGLQLCPPCSSAFDKAGAA